MQIVTVSWLRSLDVFNHVPDEQLQWLLDNSEHRLLDDGDFLFKPGDPMTGPHLIISGRMHLYMVQNGSRREITTFSKGDITGYLPYSRGKVSGGYAEATDGLQVMSLPTEKVQEMIKMHFELTQSLVHVMSNRVRDFATLQQQNEKMMALGKLSAGLAHELNNPASAIVRDSVSLKEHLRLEPELFRDMATMSLDKMQIGALNKELFIILSATNHPSLTLKQRTSLEDEIADWFAEHEVENGYVIAGNFVDFNFTLNNLQTCAASIPSASLTPVFNWISNLLVTERMVDDIQESSRRIADLVNSIKNFTHMDRAQDKQYADIHTGIRNTLTMLGYKIRKGNITIIEDYDETLPQVKGFIGELNQVWTNLIDNALDAMEVNGKGTLTIKTTRDREFVEVTITDDGPGITKEILSNIFDPFFTTKPMGKGTGMGLEVVQRIIHQHNGTVKVKSVPACTEFIVCFPLNS